MLRPVEQRVSLLRRQRHECTTIACRPPPIITSGVLNSVNVMPTTFARADVATTIAVAATAASKKLALSLLLLPICRAHKCCHAVLKSLLISLERAPQICGGFDRLPPSDLLATRLWAAP